MLVCCTGLENEADQLAQEIAGDTKAALASDTDFPAISSSTTTVATWGSGTVDADASDLTETAVTQPDATANDAAAPLGQRCSTSSIWSTLPGEIQLQQLLAKHVLAPEKQKQQVQEAFSTMVQQHQQQVQQLVAAAGQQSGNQAGTYGKMN